jgi:hypothetical protein
MRQAWPQRHRNRRAVVDAGEMLPEAASLCFLKPVRLDDETREAAREGRAQAERSEFASDEEMAALFKRYSEP